MAIDEIWAAAGHDTQMFLVIENIRGENYFSERQQQLLSPPVEIEREAGQWLPVSAHCLLG